MPAALVDTGPLVALFVRNDPDHALVADFLRGFRGNLLTTWPVLTGVCHFLSPAVALRFLRWVDAGGAGPINVPPDELVWLAGQAGVREILTLDKGDFATFRTPSGKPFKDLLATARARR